MRQADRDALRSELRAASSLSSLQAPTGGSPGPAHSTCRITGAQSDGERRTAEASAAEATSANARGDANLNGSLGITPLLAVDFAALYRTPAVGTLAKTAEERLEAALEDEPTQQLMVLDAKSRKADAAIAALVECGGDAAAAREAMPQ